MACSHEECYNQVVVSCSGCENLPLFCQDHIQTHLASVGHYRLNEIGDQYQLLWKRELKRKQKAIINQIILEENKIISIIQSASKYTIESIKNISKNLKNSYEYFLIKEDIMKHLENLLHTFELIKKPANDFFNNYENRRLKIINENSVKAKEVMFISTITTLPGSDVYISGSCSELGNWNTEQAVRLEWKNNFWSKKVLFQSSDIEFKYLIKIPDGNVLWEVGNNHKVQFNNCLSYISKFDQYYKNETRRILFFEIGKYKVFIEFPNYVIDLTINQ